MNPAFGAAFVLLCATHSLAQTASQVPRLPVPADPTRVISNTTVPGEGEQYERFQELGGEILDFGIGKFPGQLFRIEVLSWYCKNQKLYLNLEFKIYDSNPQRQSVLIATADFIKNKFIAFEEVQLQPGSNTYVIQLDPADAHLWEDSNSSNGLKIRAHIKDTWQGIFWGSAYPKERVQ